MSIPLLLGRQQEHAPRRDLTEGRRWSDSLIAFHDSTLTASNLQTAWHMPHLTQSSWSISWGSPASPGIAPTGHSRTQARQPVQVSGFDGVFQQGPANQGRTFFMQDMGLVFLPEVLQGAEHRVDGALPQAAEGGGAMVAHSSSISARCSSWPSPWVISVRISSRCLVPSRQGVHLPQDSS